MTGPRLIGYWFAPGPPALLTLPRPQRLVGRDVQRDVVAYLRAGAIYERYPRASWCRFRCGATARELGRDERSDGAWVWPDGLAHYVEAHGVRLPPAFLADVARGGPARARRGPDEAATWRRWARPASLPLDPRWEPIRGRVTAPGTALARRGDHVLASHRRRLVVVSARTGDILDAARDDDEAALDRVVGVYTPT